MSVEKVNYVYIGTVFFLLGCYAALEWCNLQSYNFVLFGVLLVLLVCLRLHRLRKFWGVVVCGLFLVLGAWAGSNAHPNPSEQLQPYFGKEVLAYGSIVPESVKRYPYGTSFILRCEGLQIKNTYEILGQAFSEKTLLEKRAVENIESNLGEKMLIPNLEDRFQIVDYFQKLRVFTKDKELSQMGKVWCKGELLPLNVLRNPGGFDGERWNYLQGLGGRLRKTQVIVVKEEGSLRDELTLLNLKLRERIMSVSSGEAGMLLCGMLLGGSVGLSDEVREAFADNGLAHLLSVSGTHFALLAGFLLLVLRPLPEKVRKLCVFLLLCGYVLLCGFRPAVLRALCMSTVLLFGGSGAVRGSLLCITGMVLLCFSPAWLLDVGFQLSFGAVAGLIWLYPKLKAYYCCYLPTLLGEAMAVTTAAQLAVLPLLVGYFHQVPLVSLVSNILLVPVLELAAILTILGLALESVTLLPLLGECLDFVLLEGESLIGFSAWLVKQVLVQAKFLASLPFSTVVVGSLPLWSGVVYYFGLLLWADVPCLQFLRNRERRGFLILTGTILLGTLLWKQLAPMPFTTYFLDVGQGDCAVIVTPARKVIVIDTGGLRNFDTGSRVLVPFLRSLGKSKVDALLLSHGDYDHAGGAEGLARNMKLEKIILPATESVSEAEKALLRKAEDSFVERASVGRKYELDGTVLEIVAVPRLKQGKQSKDEDVKRLMQAKSGNEGSTVVAVKHGEHSLLFTGDMNASRERLLNNLEQYDVLKVAHHGSRYSSSMKFLEQVQPKIAVISVGVGNRYGHPHTETLERLASVGSVVLRTDELGAIKVTFDDEGIKCYSYVYNPKNF